MTMILAGLVYWSKNLALYLVAYRIDRNAAVYIKREREHGLETGINNTQRYITIRIDAWGHSQNAKYQDE